jgi:hypothetical protein
LVPVKTYATPADPVFCGGNTLTPQERKGNIRGMISPNNLPTTRLIDLITGGEDLVLVCHHCDRQEVWDHDEILSRFPLVMMIKVGDVSWRLRCETCGKTPVVKSVEGRQYDQHFKPTAWDTQVHRLRYIERKLAEYGIEPGSLGLPPLSG